MGVKQLSVFVANEPGQILGVTKSIASSGASIRGLCASDTADFGIVRIVVDKTEIAQEAVTQEGFLARISDVICIRLEDVAGQLNAMFDAVASAGIDILYAYSLTNSYLVIMTNDQDMAIKVLKDAGANLVDDNLEI